MSGSGSGRGDSPPAEGRRGVIRAVWRFLVGQPLQLAQAAKEQITPVEGLSALSLDALTSVAYGPEAILVVLAAAGVGALPLVLPVTMAIVVLLAILVFSYRHVIDAYPGGGGAYAVSRENFGSGVSQLAAASLIVDYTLTVAVSIAAGVGALTSAFPDLSPWTVPLCLGILALITVLNLRGLGEGARAFLLPTMLFIIGLFAVIAVGLVHPLGTATPLPGTPTVPTHGLETVGTLLVLKAFAAGCSALTGVEAIANGVPLFKQPRVVRAKRTELLLGVILGAMLVGLAILAVRFHITPRTGQTVLSQIMSEAVGRNWVYYLVSITITVVLALAANTSFGGLPVLASLLARDNYLPHAFALRGDRLVFSNGIWVLTIMSAALLIAVTGNTDTLIPLFAIGVFIGFTLAQSGLVVRWWRRRPRGWRHRAVINGVGAAASGVSTVIFLVAKFTEGAWVVVVALPLFVLLFHRVRRYYDQVATVLRLGQIPPPPAGKPTLAIVPVTSVSLLTFQVLSEALSLADEVVAVTVALDFDQQHQDGSPERPATTEGTTTTDSVAQLQRLWERWHPGVALEVLHSDYASIVQPIIEFVDRMRTRRDDQIVVLIPVVIPTRLRYRILHNQLDLVLSHALRTRPNVVVARIPLTLPILDHPASPGPRLRDASLP
ncbi:MAG: amino acid permease [Pseudonocardiales bacterium]|nr:amino acid permease [Pseudonocardiales bacterium]